MKWFKKKPVEQDLMIGDNLRNFRLLGDEAEILGNRLDHARAMAANARAVWAKQYWSQAVERLLFQWRQLPVLHDSDSKMTVVPRWTVGYDFYEKSEEAGVYGVTDRFYDAVFGREADLSASWEAHRAARLARAQ
jgi:hypothetical protein